jgi:SAM-dependent methyltransferase
MDPASSAPSPALLFDTLNAYQKTAALKAALELDLFTAVGANLGGAEELAAQCQASPRGIRILCDYLTICGFLVKQGDRYELTPDSAAFLDRKSPMYAGGIAEFILSPPITQPFDDLAGAVRKGGTSSTDQGTVAPDHPVWVRFARGMGALMAPTAHAAAALIQIDPSRPAKILDIAASHGIYGIMAVKPYPLAHLVALDWEAVLAITKQNAEGAGLAGRFSTLAGDAFTTQFGVDYDAILVPNFLHHFNFEDCVSFLKKVHAALRPGGQVVIVEFVPNDDRVTPPPAASFSLVMLGTTPEGDAYTFAELEGMLGQAGFASAAIHPLPPSAQCAVVAMK